MQVYVKEDGITYQYHLATNSWSVFHDDKMYSHAVTNKGIASGDSGEDGTILPGLYKFKTNAEGHVIGIAKVTKEDIANLGVKITDNNTTYENASESASGLMSATDFTKLKGIAENANNYSHPTHQQYAEGLYKITVNNLGHVTKAAAVTADDITSLVDIPDAPDVLEVTQEEYDNLSEEEKMNGTMYLITDAELDTYTHIVEITQEEYDALSQAEKMNGTMYMITDGVSERYTALKEVTQEEYNALPQSEKMNGTLYFITDGSTPIEASGITFDNTDTGLASTDVQGAIVELKNILGDVEAILATI